MKHSIFAIVSMALFALTACTGISKVEKDVQKDLEKEKERHVICLKTGEVTLPTISNFPHVKYPSGGLKLGFGNVYVVNGGFLGRLVECQGCDSCMTCYQKAGLIKYEVKERKDQTVVANIELTSKGKKYLIENYVGSNSEIEELRNEKQVELLLVSKEKFELDIKKSADNSHTYFCDAHRCLEMTPFLEAIGGVDRNENTVKYPWKLKIEYDGDDEPSITRID